MGVVINRCEEGSSYRVAAETQNALNIAASSSGSCSGGSDSDSDRHCSSAGLIPYICSAFPGKRRRIERRLCCARMGFAVPIVAARIGFDLSLAVRAAGLFIFYHSMMGGVTGWQPEACSVVYTFRPVANFQKIRLNTIRFLDGPYGSIHNAQLDHNQDKSSHRNQGIDQRGSDDLFEVRNFFLGFGGSVVGGVIIVLSGLRLYDDRGSRRSDRNLCLLSGVGFCFGCVAIVLGYCFATGVSLW